MLKASYPGQRARRPSAAVLAALLALAVGLAAGWAAFGLASGQAEPQVSPCPGTQRGEEQQARAAGCLLDNYLVLTNAPKTVRDRELAELVLPSELAKFRKDYRSPGVAPVNPPNEPARYAKITAEYASVVAVKPGAGPTAPYQAPDVGYRAWVSVVDAYASGSPPLANWYLGDFAVRWQHGRWWLTGAFRAEENATPMTYTQGPEARAFGSGWVGV